MEVQHYMADLSLLLNWILQDQTTRESEVDQLPQKRPGPIYQEFQNHSLISPWKAGLKHRVGLTQSRTEQLFQ